MPTRRAVPRLKNYWSGSPALGGGKAADAGRHGAQMENVRRVLRRGAETKHRDGERTSRPPSKSPAQERRHGGRRLPPEGLAALFDKQNFNVLVLTPKITKQSDGPSSLEFLATGHLPLDEIFSGQKLFLPTPMALALRTGGWQTDRGPQRGDAARGEGVG